MNSSHAVVLLRAQALESIVGALVGEFSGIGTKMIEVQYWRFENSCGKEVGRRGRGTRPHEPQRRLSFPTPRQGHNLNEYKVKKA